MDNIKLKEEQLKIEKKLIKSGQKDLAVELREMTDRGEKDKLEFKLKELSKHNQSLISQAISDEELQNARQIAKDLGKTYLEQAAGNRQKARLIGLLLQELNNFQE